MYLKHNISALSLLAAICGGIVWLYDQDEDLSSEAKPFVVSVNAQSRATNKPQIEETTAQQNVDDGLSTPALTSISLPLKQVAYMHQQKLQYPPYSQPITSDDSPYLNWNEFIELPLPVLDGNSMASLSVKKFRHFYPDEIEVVLKTSEPLISTVLEVVSVEEQKILASLPSSSKQWSIVPDPNWPEEIRLVANLDFELGEDVVSADIRLYHPVATILSVGQSYASGPDMLLPVTLDVSQAGIYRVRANLYQSEGKAIASLVQKQHLSEGDQTLELKAFKSVLPKGSNNFELRNIVVERMSGYPGEKTGYGLSESESYPVGTFNSETLSDEEYQMSEQERQQVAFLEQLL
ncbi:hypothetical protein OPW07_17735 [Vibrio europaeus]|uniref:hypothetical protein n=1 Tax=Vibrio europaeus TaxID=300876 RepID=UPI0018A71029|nr:hypothetical protein [Vibrio europaeus]MDC5811561.1 hypothetical protein [Vibrio europaeus]MDC5851842.1 hypothetical protein [Vibrio europaeus]QPG34511.1 hypothetical protein IXK98_01940 [Vibrio europaeus]